MSAALGTLDWVRHTHGRMAWRDRLGFLAQGAAAHLDAARRRGRAGAAGTGSPHQSAADIRLPDSAICQAAHALAERVCTPALLAHSFRTYYWARLLDADERPWDDEALFVAVMLHDLGLTDAMRLPDDSRQCFTLVGAEQAEALAARHGWSEARAHLASQAITLHLNIVVDARHGKEAQMLRSGSGGDVAGLGLERLPASTLNEVVNRYPRGAFMSEVIQSLQTETRARPCCRTAFLCQHLGFIELIRKNPALKR